MVVDHANPAHFYEQVTEDLRRLIRQGKFPPGSRLPSIGKLSTNYQVSEITIRKAVNKLAEEQLIISRKGVGLFVRRSLVDVEIRVCVPERVGSVDTFQVNTFNLLDNYAGICREAQKYGCKVVTTRADRSILTSRPGRSNRVGYIFLHEQGFEELLDELASRRIPYVVAEGLSEKHSSVGIDMQQGAYLATDYLVQLGHRRIALLTGSANNEWYTPRIHGYRKTLEDNGIAFEPQLVRECDDDDPEQLNRCVEELLEQFPTAMFAANDRRALHTLNCLQKRAVAVPGDLSLIGYDDIPESSECRPALSTVSAPRERVGEEAVRLILNMLEGKVEDFPVRMDLGCSLVVRETTGAYDAQSPGARIHARR